MNTVTETTYEQSLSLQRDVMRVARLWVRVLRSHWDLSLSDQDWSDHPKAPFVYQDLTRAATEQCLSFVLEEGSFLAFVRLDALRAAMSHRTRTGLSASTLDHELSQNPDWAAAQVSIQAHRTHRDHLQSVTLRQQQAKLEKAQMLNIVMKSRTATSIRSFRKPGASEALEAARQAIKNTHAQIAQSHSALQKVIRPELVGRVGLQMTAAWIADAAAIASALDDTDIPDVVVTGRPTIPFAAR